MKKINIKRFTPVGADYYRDIDGRFYRLAVDNETGNLFVLRTYTYEDGTEKTEYTRVYFVSTWAKMKESLKRDEEEFYAYFDDMFEPI